MFRFLYTAAAIAVVRPYVRREWLGWGFLYRNLIGDFRRDWLWRGQRQRWVRGKLHGYEMSVRIDGWSNRATYFLERFYDLPTQLLLMKLLRAGGTFVDVGANEGMMSLLASRLVEPGGKVISFEPNPVPRAILEAAIERNGIGNISVRAAGIGDAEGSFDLFVPRINTGEGSFVASPNADGETVTCKVLLGDNELEGVTPELIKIDVEGFEMRVLRGLQATLVRARPVVVMEMIAGHLARDGGTPADVATMFESLNYVGRKLAITGKGRAKRLAFEDVPDLWCDGDYVWIPKESLGQVNDWALNERRS